MSLWKNSLRRSGSISNGAGFCQSPTGHRLTWAIRLDGELSIIGWILLLTVIESRA